MELGSSPLRGLVKVTVSVCRVCDFDEPVTYFT